MITEKSSIEVRRVNNMEEKLIRAALLQIRGFGSQKLRRLIALFGSASKAWMNQDLPYELVRSSWFQSFQQSKNQLDLDRTCFALERHEISMVMLGEKEYPCLLAECPDAPPLLFYKGELCPKEEGLAMVGSRRATAYGKAAASHLAKEIVARGLVVVSGLARGIDTASHLGALDGGGRTWAFLAGGLDQIYPAENKKLAERIMEKGALISEYPPGIPAEPGQFPARNRLISGASRGVVVIEAAEKSGSLITVDFALEQGREVYAVPGPIFSEQSKGTHQLIKSGAKLVGDSDDILSELPPRTRGSYAQQSEILAQPSKEYIKGEKNRVEDSPWQEILQLLSDTPLHIDQLTTACTLSADNIALGLLELQLSGEILQLPGQNFVLQRRK